MAARQGVSQMVWLKADSGLVNTYKKLITASRADVDWQGEILVQNNTIILPGSINSFIFDFELRKVYSNIIDIPEMQEEAFETEGRKFLANIFNLLLYVFGKWGALQGIRVPHSYARIDLLLKQILKEINSEAYYSDSGIRFTTNGLSVVFEDIISAAIDKIKADEKAESEKLQEEAIQEDSEEGPQGLWHDMKWKVLRESFNKQELDNKKAATDRLGSNFYMIPYVCPSCGNHLHMSVYPNGREFAIDTEEGKVYMARVYMCPSCCRFYTPRPWKLLSDGEVYILDFDNDEKAAEDYKKLIGRKGRKTSNSNFNMYETEYTDRVRGGNKSLAKICSRIKDLADEDLESLLRQMDEGFFSDNEIERFLAYIEQELEYRRNNARQRLEEDTEIETDKDSVMDAIVKSYMGGDSVRESDNNAEDIATDIDYSGDTKASVEADVVQDNGNDRDSKEASNKEVRNKKEANSSKKTKSSYRTKEKQKIKDSIEAEENKKIDDDNQNIDSIEYIESAESVRDIENTNNTENGKNTENRENNKNKYIFTSKEAAIKEIKASRNKKYPDIQKLARDIENSSLSSEDKEELARQLQEMLEQTGKRELDYLVSHIPQNDSKERYRRIKERIKSYKEIDTSKYEEIADEFIQNAERAELNAMVRNAGTKDRRSILELMEKLKNGDFDLGILKEYNDELYNQLREIDTETVRKICPDISALDVEDGIRAMQEIEAADILQEIKSEMTALIDRRLTRMKTEESLQLVEKLKRSLDKSIEDSSRIHYYDARKMQEGDNTDDESILIRKAISRYAVLLGKYEYPVMICDSSLFGNGKDGFIITPDHIFYKGMVKSGQLDVMDIEDISLENGKNIFINRKSGKKLKLPCALKGKDQKSMALALNDFATYLKAKPKSRSIEYMAQEKHTTICCYRCGHVFKEGNICPKCGSRN